MSNLSEIYTEWQNNPKFREDFKKDPEKALREAGLPFDAENLKKLTSMFEELEKRINK